jgi:hypothetical protein
VLGSGVSRNSSIQEKWLLELNNSDLPPVASVRRMALRPRRHGSSLLTTTEGVATALAGAGSKAAFPYFEGSRQENMGVKGEHGAFRGR